MKFKNRQSTPIKLPKLGPMDNCGAMPRTGTLLYCILRGRYT